MNAGTLGMDLSRVYRHREMQTTSIARSQELLSHSLSEHELRSSASDLDLTMYSAGSRRLKMMVLRYGPEVEIKGKPFDDFFVVQMPLHGSAEIVSDGHRITVEKGQAAIIAPTRNLRLNWSRDCEQLIVRMPMSLMREASASCATWHPPRRAGSPLVSPAMVINDDMATRWGGLMQAFTELALPACGAPGGAGLPSWLDHVEFNLALFLLTQERQQTAGDIWVDPDDATEEARPALPGGPLEAPLAAMERYVMSRLCAPIALEDLARASGVSSRSLHMYCKRRFGVGPMVWLRNMRLDAARQKLGSDAHCLITDVAMDFGFGHLGRFSAYYRERFGELPRDTAAARR